MIHLKDDLYIDANEEEYRLLRRYQKKDGKGYDYQHKGYYPSLPFLIRAATERKLRELISASNDWSEVLDSITEWARSLQSPLVVNLKEAVRQFEDNSEKDKDANSNS